MVDGIGQLIYNKRIEKGLSLHDVASELKISDPTVLRWERGEIKNMKRNHIAKLAQVLGVSPLLLLGIPDDKTGTDMKKVPLIGSIACGAPIFADENIEGYEYVPYRYHADFALRAKGDSMIDAHINDGDIVFIQQVNDVDNGTIAAVLVDDSATLKRVYKSKGCVILSPANDKYEPMVFTERDCRDIRILGKAVALQADIK